MCSGGLPKKQHSKYDKSKDIMSPKKNNNKTNKPKTHTEQTNKQKQIKNPLAI